MCAAASSGERVRIVSTGTVVQCQRVFCVEQAVLPQNGGNGERDAYHATQNRAHVKQRQPRPAHHASPASLPTMRTCTRILPPAVELPNRMSLGPTPPLPACSPLRSVQNGNERPWSTEKPDVVRTGFSGRPPFTHANHGLRTRSLQRPEKFPSRSFRTRESQIPRCGIFLMWALPIIEEILNRVQNDVLEFGIFRDVSIKRLQLKLNP